MLLYIFFALLSKKRNFKHEKVFVVDFVDFELL